MTSSFLLLGYHCYIDDDDILSGLHILAHCGMGR